MMKTIFPAKTAPELDSDVELARYIQQCRIMHHGITPSPRFAHAVSALADRVDALSEQLQYAADSFRSHGFSVDADECEEAIRGSKPAEQPLPLPIPHDDPANIDYGADMADGPQTPLPPWHPTQRGLKK